jgi:hypothetical protein
LLALAAAGSAYVTREERFFVAVVEGRVWQARVATSLRPSLLMMHHNGILTALHLAAVQHEMGMIDFLASSGADVNARAGRGIDLSWVPVHETRGGERPLHCALWRERPAPTVERLLSYGADPNAPDDDGSTPLHLAACMGQASAVRALIAGGAPVNAIDNSGRTPLHQAVWCGASELLPGQSRAAEILLANGANPHAQDSQGNTPLALAREIERDVRGWLKAKGWENPDLPAGLKSGERAAIIRILEAATSGPAEQ